MHSNYLTSSNVLICYFNVWVGYIITTNHMTPCQTHQVILTVITDRDLVIMSCQCQKKPRRWLLFNTINMQKIILWVTKFNNNRKSLLILKTNDLFISFTKLILFSNKIFCLYKIENCSNYFLNYDFKQN